jgi:hypothetical protein
MRRTMFMLVVMGTTLALAAGVALAQGQGAETSRGPIDDFVLSAEDCAGETILVRGKLNSVFHIVEDEDGFLHVNTHFNFAHTEGVGQVTGVKYVVPTTVHSIQTLTQPGQLISTDVSSSLTVSQGQVPNQLATAVIHFVIDPDGTVKAEVVEFRFECRDGSPASPSASAPA